MHCGTSMSRPSINKRATNRAGIPTSVCVLIKGRAMHLPSLGGSVCFVRIRRQLNTAGEKRRGEGKFEDAKGDE